MKQYLDLLRKIRAEGELKQSRTGLNCYSLFGYQLMLDLQAGFPLLTTKKLHLPSIIYELLWFIRGDTNIAYLQQHGVSIWDEWADQHGELGPVYGKQWRAWPTAKGETIDQLTKLVQGLRTDPHSRRHLVSAWNVGELAAMKLPPCHVLFQFYVNKQGLSCALYQRSADVFLGVPFNLASYALLTIMLAQVCGLKAHRLVHNFGDVHLYENHVQQADLQLRRRPGPLPQMLLNPAIKELFDFTYQDFRLTNYHPHPHIKAKVAI